MKIETIDIIIVAIYIAVMLSLLCYFSFKFGDNHSLRHYFMANKSLPWWMVGVSVIAVNLSTEHFIVLNNAAAKMGLMLISYEWVAALALLVIAKYWLPLCYSRGIYTLPQLLQQRISRNARTLLSGYWLVFYVFITLTGLFWLAADAIHMMTGLPPGWIISVLTILACLPVLTFGMMRLSLLDMLNFSLMFIIGGVVLFYASDIAAKELGTHSLLGTLNHIHQLHPEKFDLLLEPGQPFYEEMPTISVLIGGMWLLNLYFWGLNQTNVQRMLAGRSLQDCQKGLLLASAVKVILPTFIILPGILMLAISNIESGEQTAYQHIYQLLPAGAKGLAIVSILAAVLSSLSSIAISVSALFSFDIYAANYFRQAKTPPLWLTKFTGIFALFISALLAVPLLSNWQQGFFYIQFVGMVFCPALLVIFISIFLFKASNAASLLLPVVLSLGCGIGFKIWEPSFPFMHQIEISFILCILGSIVARLLAKDQGCRQVTFDFPMVKTSRSFNYYAGVIAVIIYSCYLILN